MSTSFEKIKDTDQLQDYLQKHAASGNVIAGGAARARDASPVANDYVGMKKQKNVKVGNQATGAASDRYEKQTAKEEAKKQGLEDEVRSLHAEIDYSKKDATRHIVQANLSSDVLRKKLLRNLEGVRKNKPILNSEAGSVKSVLSRISKASARAS